MSPGLLLPAGTFYVDGDLKSYYEETDRKGSKQLRDGKLDYTVIERFKQAGFADLENSKRKPGFKFTGSYPTKIDKPGNFGSARRIDYVMATGRLAKRCSHAETIATDATWVLSDHLPVVAEFSARR